MIDILKFVGITVVVFVVSLPLIGLVVTTVMRVCDWLKYLAKGRND